MRIGSRLAASYPSPSAKNPLSDRKRRRRGSSVVPVYVRIAPEYSNGTNLRQPRAGAGIA